MKYLFQLLTSSLLLLLVFLSPPTAYTAFVGPSTGCGTNEVNTALGCISTSVDTTGNSFFGSVIKIAVGLGGGLALLLMLYGVFIVTTSAGIPEKLKEGKEIISSAVAGLLFIIMAIFLMNLVGVKILAIPGL